MPTRSLLKSSRLTKPKPKGAVALFGEKYGDKVRVVSMGPSIEFCGGTHARNTGDIELCLISRDEAIASGVRRIEAEVGQAAKIEPGVLESPYRDIKTGCLSFKHAVDLELDQPQIAGVIRTLEQFNESNAKVAELGGELDVTVYAVKRYQNRPIHLVSQSQAINREIQASISSSMAKSPMSCWIHSRHPRHRASSLRC